MTPYETRSMRARALARACGVEDGLSVLGGLDAGQPELGCQVRSREPEKVHTISQLKNRA